ADHEDRINDEMRYAEQDLAAGKYMAAEEKYRSVLLGEKNRPMAVVVLIHAELGEGRIRTAEFNLRWLFEKYPELAATRYQARLLPNEARLRVIGRQLQQMMRT